MDVDFANAIDPSVQTGVYGLFCAVGGGKWYIGSAGKSFSSRWAKHRYALRNGIHHAPHLQHAWDYYGEEAFEFRVLATCPPSECTALEQNFIDAFRALDSAYGYNVCPTAGSPFGRKATNETLEKLRARTHSEGTRRKISERTKANWADPDKRAKMHECIERGKKSVRWDLVGAKKRGYKHGPEAVAKIAAALRARTPEQHAKMVATSRARGVYDRQAEAMRQRTRSAETQLKMAASQKIRCADPVERARLRAVADRGRQNRWLVHRAKQAGTYMEIDFQ